MFWLYFYSFKNPGVVLDSGIPFSLAAQVVWCDPCGEVCPACWSLWQLFVFLYMWSSLVGCVACKTHSGVWGDKFHLNMFCCITFVVFDWMVVKNPTGALHCLKFP